MYSVWFELAYNPLVNSYSFSYFALQFVTAGQIVFDFYGSDNKDI